MRQQLQIKRENWKGSYYFVARVDGKIRSYAKVKGNRTPLSTYKSLFNDRGTFSTKYKLIVENLTNVTEYKKITRADYSKLSRTPQNPNSVSAQYIVEGYLNGEYVMGKSQKLGSPLAKDKREAKREAWRNFIKNLSYKALRRTDEDEGVYLIEKVGGLTEGWIYYRPI